MPPGRCFALVVPMESGGASAVWGTSWPYFAKHPWQGAWMCTVFRNEHPELHLSSDLIRQAVAVTRAIYPAVPELGMITLVDEDKTRRKRDPGRCYLRAGFRRVGYMKSGHIVLQLLPADMPEAMEPHGWQQRLDL